MAEDLRGYAQNAGISQDCPRRCIYARIYEFAMDRLKNLLTIIADEKDERLPIDARASLIVLAAQLQALQMMIGSIEKRIIAQHRASEESRRVATVPGIGTLGATAITATVTDPSAFRSGRDFAAWIGLVP